jgi:hypothetical protein
MKYYILVDTVGGQSYQSDSYEMTDKERDEEILHYQRILDNSRSIKITNSKNMFVINTRHIVSVEIIVDREKDNE